MGALLTPGQLRRLPKGTRLRSINGRTAVKGRDYIDTDTRFGLTAWEVAPSRFIKRDSATGRFITMRKTSGPFAHRKRH